jgi:hypothetical protein
MAVVASLLNAMAGRLFGGIGQTNIPIFAGSQNLGGALMLLFFAVVGTAAFQITIFLILLSIPDTSNSTIVAREVRIRRSYTPRFYIAT